MNPDKIDEDLFLHHHQRRSHHDPVPPHHHLTPQTHPQPSIHNPDPPDPFPEIALFRSSSDESSDDNDDGPPLPAAAADQPPAHISPDPHISSQFYTFNAQSHALMIQCILDHRLAAPAEIRAATPRAVLKSWRAVWKDRNEDTAYLTAWKRIQEKLSAHIDPSSGNKFLCFKNNSQQFVSHIDQWQEIVTNFHGDADLKHLGLKETIERIKQVWTVGAKFYGIPESYIRVCIGSCPVCSSNSSSGSALRNKRRKFEYTESIDVPAMEVQSRLQQLAAKHKVVLCIRQKYIRYKPFMAEVKDYACHRAGEPAVKRSKILKREPYASKRCGCGFRIRAIVPITNYNEKDKTFVYQEEGIAVFKLYAVHSGHEPGPLDGNARIMHRVVGHKGVFLSDQEAVYGVSEDGEHEGFGGDLRLSVLQQVQELRAEIGLLEAKITKMPHEVLGSLSQDLFDVVNRVRSIGDESSSSNSKPVEIVSQKQHDDDVLVGENGLAHWSEHHELIEDDEDSFGQTLGDVVPWDEMREEGDRSHKDMMSEPCKPEKWSILDCEDTKLTKPMRHDEAIVTDVGLVGIHVDSFYQDHHPKWYDSPCGLDPGGDDGGFRHGEIV